MLATAIDFVTCKSKELSTLISSSFRRLNFIVIVFCNNVVVFLKLFFKSCSCTIDQIVYDKVQFH